MRSAAWESTPLHSALAVLTAAFPHGTLNAARTVPPDCGLILKSLPENASNVTLMGPLTARSRSRPTSMVLLCTIRSVEKLRTGPVIVPSIVAMPLIGTGGGGTHLIAVSRLTLPFSASPSDGESSTRVISPLRNASISVEDSRACSRFTFAPSNVITVSNGAMVMVRSRSRNDSGPRTAKSPLAPTAVFNSSDSMRGIFTPQLRTLSSYCTSRPLSVSDLMSSSRARSGVGRVEPGGRLTTLFSSRTISMMAPSITR